MVMCLGDLVSSLCYRLLSGGSVVYVVLLCIRCVLLCVVRLFLMSMLVRCVVSVVCFGVGCYVLVNMLSVLNVCSMYRLVSMLSSGRILVKCCV